MVGTSRDGGPTASAQPADGEPARFRDSLAALAIWLLVGIAGWIVLLRVLAKLLSSLVFTATSGSS